VQGPNSLQRAASPGVQVLASGGCNRRIKLKHLLRLIIVRHKEKYPIERTRIVADEFGPGTCRVREFEIKRLHRAVISQGQVIVHQQVEFAQAVRPRGIFLDLSRRRARSASTIDCSEYDRLPHGNVSQP